MTAHFLGIEEIFSNHTGIACVRVNRKRDKE